MNVETTNKNNLKIRDKLIFAASVYILSINMWEQWYLLFLAMDITVNRAGCWNVEKLKRQLHTDRNYRNAIRSNYSARVGYGHLAENIDLSGSSYWMQISHGCSCLFGTSARSFYPLPPPPSHPSKYRRPTNSSRYRGLFAQMPVVNYD